MYTRKPSFLILVFFIFFFFTVSVAQETGKFKGHNSTGNTVSVNYENALLQIEICTENIIRIRTSWDGEFEPEENLMVTTYDWPETEYTISETGNRLVIQTKELNVELTKTDFNIQVFTSERKLLTSGLDHIKKGDSVTAKMQLLADEHFFGFGERMDVLDRRGRSVDLNVGRGEKRPHIVGAYNVLEANYAPVPFFMSTRGYGVFLHNSFRNHWDMGAGDPNSYAFTAAGGELDYYIIHGPDFKNILDRYTRITGKSPLMNRFAFGLHVGTYSGGTWGHEELTSTEYVINLVRRFRQLNIPIDILHLDSTWRIFGEEGGKGATTFEWRETFDHPEAMFDSLYDLNINMVGVHLRPRFDNGNSLRLLDEARSLKHVYPEENSPGEFVNFFDPDAVDWWWNNGVMRVASQGAMFLKTDEGSAFGRKANESDKLGPTGKETERLHNVFPLAYAKAPYEKFQEYNGMRGMNHTREGYAGIQRYPFIFAGDWPSEWQYFAPVIKAGLNIGLSGVGYWAHCMGGFEHNADPELYIRWTQFGLLSPVAHLFGMDHPGYKEPWNYGEEALANFKTYDSLRYTLLPYLYTAGYEMNQTGIPLMRALVLEYQNDHATYTIDDQYLLGDAILISPVTVKGAQTRSLYLPEGIWYNHWDGKIYRGKNYIQVVTPLDEMPIFYRGGTIIPSQVQVQYIGRTPAEEIILNIYPDNEMVASGVLYDDDGISLDYSEGVFSLTSFNYDNGRLTIEKAHSAYRLPERKFKINIHSDTGITHFEITKKPNEKIDINLQ